MADYFKNKMKKQLSYKSEEDKCYGITGMAIALVVFDGEDYLTSINLDADTSDEMMEFTDEFYFSGNPELSAKNVWNHILKNFNLAMALSVGNVLCRKLVFESKPLERDCAKSLLNLMNEVGRESCSLESDETQHLFEKNLNYLNRIFSHHGVQSVAHDFAEALKNRRSMTRFEVVEQLRALSML